MIGFIYITTNLINGKRYIGKRQYSYPQWNTYLGSGKILKLAIKKYGKDKFKREVIEECQTKEDLNEREKYWIEYFNAYNSKNYYNIAKGGEGGAIKKGYLKRSKEFILNNKVIAYKRLYNNQNPLAKQVICLNTNQIFCSIRDVGRKLNLSNASICQNCNWEKKYTIKNDGDDKTYLYFIYLDEFNKNPNIDYWINKKIDFHYNNKIICVNDLKIFNSTEECAKYYEIHTFNIQNVCSNHSKFTYINKEKYIFRYFDKTIDYDKYREQIFKSLNEPIKYKRNCKKVRCVELNMIFDNIGEAGTYFNVDKSCISRCCSGINKKSKGYTFEFVA